MRTFGIFARSSDPGQAPAIITTSRSFRASHSMAAAVYPRDLASSRTLADALNLYDIMDVYTMPIGVADCLPDAPLF